jgi:hypothetical protein
MTLVHAPVRVLPRCYLRGVVSGDRDELLQHLEEQRRFMASSAKSFDEGEEAEAKRLATTVRVLVHNTDRSESLLKQLGVQHRVRFLDTWRPPDPPSPGAVTVRRFDAGLAVLQLGSEEARLKAPLEPTEAKIRGPQPFRFWWNQAVIEDLQRERFTRRELILFMANKAGGAHIDPAIKPKFRALTRLNSLGWGTGMNEEGHRYVGVPASPDDEPLGNPIPANIRQIAFEVEWTLTREFG